MLLLLLLSATVTARCYCCCKCGHGSSCYCRRQQALRPPPAGVLREKRLLGSQRGQAGDGGARCRLTGLRLVEWAGSLAAAGLPDPVPAAALPGCPHLARLAHSYPADVKATTRAMLARSACAPTILFLFPCHARRPRRSISVGLASAGLQRPCGGARLHGRATQAASAPRTCARPAGACMCASCCARGQRPPGLVRATLTGVDGDAGPGPRGQQIAACQSPF